MNKHPMVNDYNLSSLRNIILGAAPVSTELILDTRAKLRAKGAKDLEITQVWSLLFHLSCILSIPTVTNFSGVRSYRDDVSKLFASRPVINHYTRRASTHILPPELSVKKVGSVGLLLPNQEARLVDEGENDVKPGDRGELWIRGPNIMKYANLSVHGIPSLIKRELTDCCIRGYLHNAEATKNSITPDGWFKTGDIATRDSEGFL